MLKNLKLRLQRTRLYPFYVRYKANQRLKKFETCSPDTLPIITKAFELTADLSGDYYEFGLYKGYSIYHAFKTAIDKKVNCRFFGFDSFEGLPEIAAIDSGAKFEKGKYACSLQRVTDNLVKNSVDMGKVSLIKGFFSDSLKDPSLKKSHAFGPAKIVMIDCDLYESTRDVLNFISSYLQDGTVLIMDDWNCFEASDSKGERLATREFLKLHPNITLEPLGEFGWHGAYFRLKIT